jgi:hypothetical protein
LHFGAMQRLALRARVALADVVAIDFVAGIDVFP